MTASVAPTGIPLRKLGGSPLTSATRNVAALLRGCEELAEQGGCLLGDAGDWTFGDGPPLPARVGFDGLGQMRVRHTGGGAFLSSLEDDFDATPRFTRRRIAGLEILGLDVVGARAIEIGNTHGAVLDRLLIVGYPTGEGIRLCNSASWTEGTVIRDTMTRNCGIHVNFLRQGGTQSFAETRLDGVTMVLNTPGAVGIQMSADTWWYGGSATIKGNIEAAGQNAIILNLHQDAHAAHNDYRIVFECYTAGCTGRQLAAGAQFLGAGYFTTIGTSAPLPNSIDAAAQDGGF